jgi:hypothetical protein
MLKKITSLLLIGLLSQHATFAAAQEPTKMSRTGYCHAPGSRYYELTKNFVAFETLSECLDERTRINSYDQPTSQPLTYENRTPYDRSYFGDWADNDSDCQNTRHELLQAQSTATATMTRNSCRVLRGRWYDPYSDMTFTNATDVEIDHLVPLAYAWSRGADTWSPALRERFANDPANLFAVSTHENRSKGPRGPTEWLPTNANFHCQYVLRFVRVTLAYKMTLSKSEKDQISKIQESVCS